jgi:gamma-glutamyltranspeptidase/glutathione hydrolase
MLQWKDAEDNLKSSHTDNSAVLMYDHSLSQLRAPKPGEVVFSPELSKTFQMLVAEGKEGFYAGPVAEAIVKAVQSGGGYLELSDLNEHLRTSSEFTTPISGTFRGQRARKQNMAFPEIWEHAPNGQGIVVLIALSLLEEFEKAGRIPQFRPEDHNTTPYLHALIESLSIAFADAHRWVSDPSHARVDARTLLSKSYLTERAKLFDPTKAGSHSYGRPLFSPMMESCDTVYLAVTDREGNAMSMVNSLYGHFGSCIVPDGYGFALQARGAAFHLGPEDHPNVYQGGKRPFHTIIPAIITRSQGVHRDLAAVLGVMGGTMQPQGQLQVFMNLEVFMMNAQEALDAPRFCVDGEGADRVVFLEEGISANVEEELTKMGHNIKRLGNWNRSTFGRGQVVKRQFDNLGGMPIYSAGSDPRGDGCAMPSM